MSGLGALALASLTLNRSATGMVGLARPGTAAARHTATA
jgi:hypothetical protein